MALSITNLVGDYGIPGLGTLKAGATQEVGVLTAGWATSKPGELQVNFGPEDGCRSTVGVYSALDASFGYGGGGLLLVEALDQLGRNVFVHRGIRTSDADMPAAVREHLQAPRALPRWTLAHCLPDSLPRVSSPRTVAYTMWETSHIPDSSRGTGSPFDFGNWAQLINEHAQRLVVPCKHNAEVFAACGVTIPISVLPYGIDVTTWPLLERPERDTFTFLQFGDLTERKGPREAVAAFQRAFPTERDVRLVLKTHSGHLGYVVDGRMPVLSDERVAIIDETWSRPRLLQQLRDADAFVWPSRGEGFGLPPLQAALTGLPVIMTTHTGMAEYHDPKFFYGVRSAGTSPSPLYGEWYDPDVDHLAEQMRKVYENRGTAARKGKSAATYVRKNFSLDAYAKRLGAFLETLED